MVDLFNRPVEEMTRAQEHSHQSISETGVVDEEEDKESRESSIIHNASQWVAGGTRILVDSSWRTGPRRPYTGGTVTR